MATQTGSIDLKGMTSAYSDQQQYFWVESSSSATWGGGAHITNVAESAFKTAAGTWETNPTAGGYNLLMNTDTANATGSLQLRNGSLPIMNLDNDSLDFNTMDITGGTYRTRTVASFGETTQIGYDDETKMILSSNSFDMIDINGRSISHIGNPTNQLLLDVFFYDSTQTNPNIFVLSETPTTIEQVTINDVATTNYTLHDLDQVTINDTLTDGDKISITYKFAGETSYYTFGYRKDGGGTEEDDYFTVGQYSFASGCLVSATGTASHAEGYNTEAKGHSSHAEGHYTIAWQNYAHAEGDECEASGYASHAEGSNTTASGSSSHAEGGSTTASAPYSHAEGNFTTASGRSSHAEGVHSVASGNMSHAEGFGTIASGVEAHAEGYNTQAYRDYCHSEGYNTKAGDKDTNVGKTSHAEGDSTYAHGASSHAEGYKTEASGNSSHAEGRNTVAIGYASHAAGEGTYAYCQETAVGAYNILSMNLDYAEEPTDTLFSVGNGYSYTDENDEEVEVRSNAFTVYRNGNLEAAGSITSAITACGNNSTDLSLTTSEQIIPMTTYRAVVGSQLSVSNNGVLCGKNGFVEVSANIYCTSEFNASDLVRLIIKKGTTNILSAVHRLATTYDYYSVAPIVYEVSAGDVLYLYSYNQTAARGKVARTIGSWMTVKYL